MRFRGHVEFPMAITKSLIKLLRLGTPLVEKTLEPPETEATLEAEAPGYSVELFIDAGLRVGGSASPPEAGEIKETVDVTTVPPATQTLDPVKLSVDVKVLQGVQRTLKAPKLSVSVEVSP